MGDARSLICPVKLRQGRLPPLLCHFFTAWLLPGFVHFLFEWIWSLSEPPTAPVSAGTVQEIHLRGVAPNNRKPLLLAHRMNVPQKYLYHCNNMEVWKWSRDSIADVKDKPAELSQKDCEATIGLNSILRDCYLKLEFTPRMQTSTCERGDFVFTEGQ